MAVNRHMSMATLMKESSLIGAGWQVQRFHPLLSWRKAWWHTGRPGAEEEAERSASDRRQQERHWSWLEHLERKAHLKTHSSSRATPPTSAIPWWPNIQIYEPIGPFSFKLPHRCMQPMAYKPYATKTGPEGSPMLFWNKNFIDETLCQKAGHAC